VAGHYGCVADCHPSFSTITRTPSSIEMMLPASVPSSRRAAPSRIVARARPTFFFTAEVWAKSDSVGYQDQSASARAANARRKIAGLYMDCVGDDSGDCGTRRERCGDDAGSR